MVIFFATEAKEVFHGGKRAIDTNLFFLARWAAPIADVYHFFRADLHDLYFVSKILLILQNHGSDISLFWHDGLHPSLTYTAPSEPISTIDISS